MGISANQARLLTLTARQHDLELRAQRISAHKMILAMQSQQWAMTYSNALKNYSAPAVTYVTEEVKFTPEFFANLQNQNANNVKVVLYKNDNDIKDPTNISKEEIEAAIEAGYGIYTQTASVQYESNEDGAALRAAMKARNDWDDWSIDVVGYTQDANGYMVKINADTIKDGNGNKVDLSGDGLSGIITLAQAATCGSVRGTVLRGGALSAYITNADLANAGVSLTGNDGSSEPIITYSYAPDTRFTAGSTTYTVTTSVTEESDVDLDVVKADYNAAMAELSSIEKILDMELTQINTEHQAVKTEYDSVKSLVSDNTERSFNVFG